MIVHVDLPPRQKKRFEKMLKNLLVPVSSAEVASLIFSSSPHPYKPTVIVGNPEGEMPDNVVDVINSRVNKEILKLKLRLYEIFIQSGDYMEILDEEFSKAKRNTMPLSVVIFKILDGDVDAVRILLFSANASSRKSDKIFNLGEGEILAILPGTDKEGAETFARRLSRRFIRSYTREKVTKKPTCVYGIAEIEDWMVLGEDLLSSAEYDLIKKLR